MPLTLRLSAQGGAPDCAARGPGADRAHLVAADMPFTTVRVAGSFAAAADAWSRLERIARVSPYQSRHWLAAWTETRGRRSGLSPFIVIAEDGGGRPIALLPLGLRRRGLLRQAEFLGGQDNNYSMGLFDPAVAWTPAAVEHLLRSAARQAQRLDMFFLGQQPLQWQGDPNPLAELPGSQPTPSSSHHTLLQRDGEAFLRQYQSSATRRKLRSKMAYLDKLGPVTHRVAASAEDIEAVTEAYLNQRADKHAAIGIAPPDRVALREFIRRAATPLDGPAPLELHSLVCADTIVATFGGMAHQGRFSGLLISYAGQPHFARSSPGELLLNAVLRAKCAEGFDSFDLGVGEARYKDTYCPIADPLVDTLMALSPLGRLVASGQGATLQVKSAIKRSPRAWRAARIVRKALGRLRRIGR